MVYKPDEDSYLIAEFVKKYAKGKKVLDMGTGTGILAETALKSGAKEVLACDIDKEAVKEAEKKGIKAVSSDLFKNVKGKFDLIIFNPPYLPKDKREGKDTDTSGGKKGYELTLRFLKQAEKHLEEKGFILIVVSSLSKPEELYSRIKELGLKYKILGEKKMFFETIYAVKADKHL